VRDRGEASAWGISGRFVTRCPIAPENRTGTLRRFGIGASRWLGYIDWALPSFSPSPVPPGCPRTGWRDTVAILRAEHLEKAFGAAAGSTSGVMAIRGVDVEIEPGQFVAITGASGSGKSTLLHLLGGITRPTAGRVLLEGVDLAALGDDDLAVVRRRRIGFVFQRYNLLPELSLVENVGLPLVLDRIPEARCDAAARAALETVGMGHRADHRPDALSGGEQQRGAIARALVTSPAIVLADEPTGALDSENSRRVVELLRTLVADHGQTVVLVTHDPGIAATAGRCIRMADGRIISDTLQPGSPVGGGRPPVPRQAPRSNGGGSGGGSGGGRRAGRKRR